MHSSVCEMLLNYDGINFITIKLLLLSYCFMMTSKACEINLEPINQNIKLISNCTYSLEIMVPTYAVLQFQGNETRWRNCSEFNYEYFDNANRSTTAWLNNDIEEHIVGPVGTILLHTFIYDNYDIELNLTINSIEDDQLNNYTQFRLNDSYGTVYRTETKIPIYFIHPNITDPEDRKTDSLESNIEIRPVVTENQEVYEKAEMYTRFMVFDYGNGTLNYVGSFHDLLVNNSDVLIISSGNLLIYVPQNPLDMNIYKMVLFISVTHRFPNTPKVIILDLPMYDENSQTNYHLLNGSAYKNGAVYHMISPNDIYMQQTNINYDYKMYSMHAMDNLSILAPCGVSIETVIQSYNSEFVDYVENRGRCLSFYMPSNESSVTFTTITDFKNLNGKYDSTYFFTSYFYPVPYINDEFQQNNDEDCPSTVSYIISNGGYYVINFTVPYADLEGGCMYFTYLHTRENGSNVEIKKCSQPNGTIHGSEVARGFNFTTKLPCKSTGILLKLSLDSSTNNTIESDYQDRASERLNSNSMMIADQNNQNNANFPNKLSSLSSERFSISKLRKENLDRDQICAPITTTSTIAFITQKSSSDTLKITLAITIPLSIIILVAIIGCIIFYYKTRYIPFFMSMNRRFRGINVKMQQQDDESRPMDPWIIKVKDVEVIEDKPLGRGAFSEVFLGKLNGEIPLFKINQNIEVQLIATSVENVNTVAVKRLLGHASDRDRSEFMKEIETMKALEFDTHIVSMYGYVASKFIPLMVLEYCELGNLLNYVKTNEDKFRNNDQTGIKELTSYSWQIADGMSYIASKDIVHRDLAARNVLLTKSKIAKISDFGLSIRSDEKVNAVTVQRGLLPIKWAAIESFGAAEFSEKSDVWSFGVTLWEIFSLGEVPYKDIMSLELQAYLRNGHRLEQPEICSAEMYSLMTKCWQKDPDDRPSFNELKDELTNLILALTEIYGYIDMPVIIPEELQA